MDNSIMEIWKDIAGFEGRYKISNMGNVVSTNYHRGGVERKMTPRKGMHGYMYINIYNNGKRYTKKIHRLVAEAFMPNPFNLPQVNHIDECKDNNNCENLEWCTAKYNSNHGTRNTRMAVSQGKTVIKLDTNGVLLQEYSSISEASRCNNINRRNIFSCCNNKKGFKTAGGYRWMYAQKE